MKGGENMLRSMFSGLSGLRNHQQGLDVIGNNIANVNTTGYKSSRIQFTELLSQTIRGAASPVSNGRGGTNPIQVGLGVGTSAVDVSHQQGNLQSTGNMSDLAIQGNGFFILSDGSSETYTRAGSFSFDANGTLVHANGTKVMGWLADTTGVIDKNSSIQGISIPVGQTIAANDTTDITYAHNLNSETYMQGDPVLADGNSAGVTRTYGTYSGNATAVPAIVDVVGTHYIEVTAENHVGDRKSLNGTETLAALNVTDIDSFRVFVDGTANAITLSNGTASTVNELVSAINSQVIGVTAELSGNAVKISRGAAGLNETVYVDDVNLMTLGNVPLNGIAANVFNSGNGKWATHARTLGNKEDVTTAQQLTGMDDSNGLVVTINGVAAGIFDPTEAVISAAITATSTVEELIDKFNTWAQDAGGLGLTGANSIFMGHTGSGATGGGSLYVAHNSNDTDGYVSIADERSGGAADIDDDGIAELFFAETKGTWDTGVDTVGEGSAFADTLTFGKKSNVATITHEFQEEDGGGTHIASLDFAGGGSTISGLDGISIIAADSGFKTGSMVINTVEATNHIASTSVYDSLGAEHTITLTLTKQGNNTWEWDASGIDTTGSGTLTFDSNGTIQSGASNGTITVGAQGGASSLSITPNFSSITQFSDPSTMVHTSQDGYPNGALSTYSIDANGEILGIYTNGLNQSLGQVAIAAFNNPGGLLKVSDSMFISSNNSGESQVGTANTGGRGALSAGTLEMSNVDVAQEFANMIIYERGFQANSKIISTGDSMLQTLVNMKR